MKGHLTAEQAAERLGYTVAWIRRLAKRGYIKGKMVGRDWFIQEKALQDFKPPKRTGRPPRVEGS